MRSLAFALLLAGCVAPPPGDEAPPAAPSFDGVPSPTLKARVQLRGQAPGALVVRVTVDRRCEGPVLLELAASDFEAGEWFDLIVGQNVFTATSISAAGKRSRCSPPLEIDRFFPPMPDPLANLIVSPGLNAATRTFGITGVAPAGTTVRMHRNSCFNDIESTLTREQFATDGFTITFAQDGFYTLAFNAIDEVGQRSQCSSVTLWSKTTPPRALFDYGSPMPTPESSAWFVATGDFLTLQAWSGPDCQGVPLGACSQLSGRCLVAVQQPDSSWTGPFSASLVDTLGNTSCVAGLPYLLDVNASTAPDLFVSSFNQLQVRVHVGRDRLDLFESADCSGPTIGTWVPSAVLGQVLRDFPRVDGGTFTVRSYVAQTTPDPCSLPLSVP